MKIKFNKIVVDSVEDHSGIFIGENFASNWSSYSKTQELIGTVKGNNNVFTDCIGVINDDDVIDVPIRGAEDIRDFPEIGHFPKKDDSNIQFASVCNRKKQKRRK